MGYLNEYLGFFDKVDKRIRNEEAHGVAGPRRAHPSRRLRIRRTATTVPRKAAQTA